VAGEILYLDSSALVKLVVPGPESEALAELVGGCESRATSVVAAVEVPRAVRRSRDDSEAAERTGRVISAVDLRVLDEDVIAVAAGFAPGALRTLGAIHLASALTLRDGLSAFVAYDQRLRAAAGEAGLPVAAPTP
jgi:hypothetical protein